MFHGMMEKCPLNANIHYEMKFVIKFNNIPQSLFTKDRTITTRESNFPFKTSSFSNTSMYSFALSCSLTRACLSLVDNGHDFQLDPINL